ncbi:MAG TPA: response regulator [Syntrophales bacterium]|nr:response regulator [Syntrophales bacterium]
MSGNGRVLVMDDEAVIQDIMQAMLNILSYEVEIASNGEEAVELFRKAHESGRPFDAVIVDLTIPGGMGGEEAIKRLSAIDRDVRAIVTSGYSADPAVTNFRDYGFCDAIIKPFNIQRLSNSLQNILSDAKKRT